MFFSKQPEKVLDLSVEEFIALDARLNEYIDGWVVAELKSGVKHDSIFAEIAIFNFKIIYDPTEKGDAMRSFISGASSVVKETDYTFSRVQDLYITIVTAFPKHFVEFVRNKHVDTLRSMGYDVDEDIVNELEFGWLLHRLQHSMRYSTRAA